MQFHLDMSKYDFIKLNRSTARTLQNLTDSSCTLTHAWAWRDVDTSFLEIMGWPSPHPHSLVFSIGPCGPWCNNISDFVCNGKKLSNCHFHSMSLKCWKLYMPYLSWETIQWWPTQSAMFGEHFEKCTNIFLKTITPINLWYVCVDHTCSYASLRPQ